MINLPNYTMSIDDIKLKQSKINYANRWCICYRCLIALSIGSKFLLVKEWHDPVGEEGTLWSDCDMIFGIGKLKACRMWWKGAKDSASDTPLIVQCLCLHQDGNWISLDTPLPHCEMLWQNHEEMIFSIAMSTLKMMVQNTELHYLL